MVVDSDKKALALAGMVPKRISLADVLGREYRLKSIAVHSPENGVGHSEVGVELNGVPEQRDCSGRIRRINELGGRTVVLQSLDGARSCFQEGSFMLANSRQRLARPGAELAGDLSQNIQDIFLTRG